MPRVSADRRTRLAPPRRSGDHRGCSGSGGHHAPEPLARDPGPARGERRGRPAGDHRGFSAQPVLRHRRGRRHGHGPARDRPARRRSCGRHGDHRCRGSLHGDRRRRLRAAMPHPRRGRRAGRHTGPADPVGRRRWPAGLRRCAAGRAERPRGRVRRRRAGRGPAAVRPLRRSHAVARGRGPRWRPVALQRRVHRPAAPVRMPTTMHTWAPATGTR
jgi:hypothetical protein